MNTLVTDLGGGEEQVRRFDIPVNDPCSMDDRECFADLNRQGYRSTRIEGSFPA